jgi:hypothetical protein
MTTETATFLLRFHHGLLLTSTGWVTVFGSTVTQKSVGEHYMDITTKFRRFWIRQQYRYRFWQCKIWHSSLFGESLCQFLHYVDNALVTRSF